MENTPPGFDPESARLESLRGTLARVRTHRRLRFAARGFAAAAVIAAGVVLMPRDQPPATIAPVVTRPGATAPSVMVVRSTPLREDQRIVSVKSPELLIISAPSPGLILRTPPDAAEKIRRLGEAEFRDLLASRGYAIMEIDGQAPRVFPLAGQ